MKLISIILPVYNAGKTIIDTLESVKMQSFRDYELIIINDGSTDDSEKKISDFVNANPEMQICTITQENKGVSAARNAGIAIAKGDYIALLDADDIWDSKKLEKQMKIIDAYKINFLASAGVGKKILFPYICNKDGLCTITFRKLMMRNEILLPSVIFKKEILKKTGFFDPEQRYAEDVNLWLRISKNYKMYLHNEPLIFAGNGKKTFGVSGLSANLKEMHKGFIKNLYEMKMHKRINILELLVYYIFYKIKYIILLFRKSLNK